MRSALSSNTLTIRSSVAWCRKSAASRRRSNEKHPEKETLLFKCEPTPQSSKKRLPTLPVIRKPPTWEKLAEKYRACACQGGIEEPALSRSLEMLSRIDEIDDMRRFMQRFAECD